MLLLTHACLIRQGREHSDKSKKKDVLDDKKHNLGNAENRVKVFR